MEYAYKYTEKGYITTFLDGTYCSHIGRRTYERNTEKLNAYDLNNEVQFGEVKKDSQKIERDPEDKQTKFSECSVYLINLKRRFDRLQSFFKNNKNLF